MASGYIHTDQTNNMEIIIYVCSQYVAAVWRAILNIEPSKWRLLFVHQLSCNVNAPFKATLTKTIFASNQSNTDGKEDDPVDQNAQVDH